MCELATFRVSVRFVLTKPGAVNKSLQRKKHKNTQINDWIFYFTCIKKFQPETGCQQLGEQQGKGRPHVGAAAGAGGTAAADQQPSSRGDPLPQIEVPHLQQGQASRFSNQS